MKIDFLVLWVDDALDFVNSIEFQLKKWLDSMGFGLRVLTYTSSVGVLEAVQKNDIELIIIDLHLPGKDGDELIADIRKAHCYQDIIFYSASPLPPTRLDGVFFVSKEDASTRITELIRLKLGRSSDPASFRGWVVADSIELEDIITDLLTQCFTHKEGYNFSARLFGHDSRLDFGAKQILLSGILGDLIQSLEAQESKDEDKIRSLRACKDIFNTFPQEVIEIRNALAHQRLEESPAGRIIKTKTKAAKPIELTEAKFIEIRKNLRKHYDNLIALRQLL